MEALDRYMYNLGGIFLPEQVSVKRLASQLIEH